MLQKVLAYFTRKKLCQIYAPNHSSICNSICHGGRGTQLLNNINIKGQQESNLVINLKENTNKVFHLWKHHMHK